jgi:hypothetical protein
MQSFWKWVYRSLKGLVLIAFFANAAATYILNAQVENIGGYSLKDYIAKSF